MRAAAASFYTRLLNGLAVYLARPVKRSGSSTPGPQELTALLLPGDVLLTEGNTRMAALVRRVTRSAWSHVSMYVGPLEGGSDPRCVVEADVAAGVRAVPLSEFDGQRVRVLRPTGLAEGERQRLADWVVGRIGAKYDLAHALALGRRMLGLPAAPSIAPVESATRFICSTLLAQAFLLAGHPIVPDHAYVTPSDFETASALEPIAVSR